MINTYIYIYIYISVYVCVCVVEDFFTSGVKSLQHRVGNCVVCKGDYVEKRGCPRGVMVKAMDCGIVVREFVLQSRYYVYFRANTLEKGMNPLILPWVK